MTKDILIFQHELLRSIRSFFYHRNYIEVQTPIVVKCPGIDPYIEALSVENGNYLITSPELHMKRVISMGHERIFQITHAFRKEELGNYHNPEFCMLEWYIKEKDYRYLMDEVIELIRYVVNNISFISSLSLDKILSFAIDDLFEKYAGWKPSVEWDEISYFKDFVDKIEPVLANMDAVIIYDFPSPLAGLSKIKADNPLVCERFELYLRGIEVANAASELLDGHEYGRRFGKANIQRKKMQKIEYPQDKDFLIALENGLPECAGIALGVERLMMAISGASSIEDVMLLPNRS